MLYKLSTDVIDHSMMKEIVLDLIDNMPSKDVGVNSINLDDNYLILNVIMNHIISNTNWQDEIFGE